MLRRSPRSVRRGPCGGDGGGGGGRWAPRLAPTAAGQLCEPAILDGAPAWSRGVACPPGSMRNVDACATEMVIIVLGADFWGGLLHSKRSLIDTGGEGACLWSQPGLGSKIWCPYYQKQALGPFPGLAEPPFLVHPIGLAMAAAKSC